MQFSSSAGPDGGADVEYCCGSSKRSANVIDTNPNSRNKYAQLRVYNY